MTTNTKHETQIIVDPDVPLVRIIREFDAPVEKVFRAHTDPDLFKQWTGPNGYENEIETFDCRTGGSYRYKTTGDGWEGWFRGSFHEIRPNSVIIQTFNYEDIPDGVSLDRIEFEDLGDGRSRVTSTSLVDSFEGRDAFIASGMEVGVNEGYQRLDALLAAS
jgi:uncharacterized protein YndB with AHSA1/START domain